jgi:hypothetical protein
MTGANTYTGQTTVSNGELIVATVFAGNGNFVVTNGATLGITNLSSGSALVSNLTAAAGTTLEFFNVSNATTPLVMASNVMISGGCTIKITGANGLAVSNTYPLINYAGNFSGAFTNLQLRMPPDWSGVLVSNANRVTLASVQPVSTTPPQLGWAVSGRQILFSWPADHTGWQLQAQTNPPGAGLGAVWTTLSNAVATNQAACPINVGNGSVFFRLVYP